MSSGNDDEENAQPRVGDSSYVAMDAVPPAPSADLEQQIDYYGLALIFLAPSLGGFLYGYDVGATSFVLAMMRESRDHDVWWYHFPKLYQGLLISTLALGALVGSHVVLVYLAKSISRRKEIRIAAALYVIGGLFNVMSGTMLATAEPYEWGGNLGLFTLLLGRMLYGAGVGFTMHGAPTYMAEMSPSRVRGAVVSAKATVIVFGIVVGMLMGDLLSDYPDDWTNLYAFSILGAVPMLLLTFKIPRSKRWLLMKGYRAEAKESMKFVYKGNIEDEFEKMAMSIDSICCRQTHVVEGDDENDLDRMAEENGDEDSLYSNKDSPFKSKRATASSSTVNDRLDSPSLCSKGYRPFLFIGLGLLVAQQFSGQPAVLAYSRVLFEAAGFQGHASVVTVVLMALASSLSVYLVDRLGRKVLLGLGCIIMIGPLLALSWSFWGWDEDDNSVKLGDFEKKTVLIAMFLFIAGYQLGFGPITWCVLSEIYPTEIRGPAMALSVEVNFAAKFLSQLGFPLLQDLLGWGWTFALFAAILVCGLFFIGAMVPETKGLSLEEIQQQMKGTYWTSPENQKEEPLLSSPPTTIVTGKPQKPKIRRLEAPLV